MDNVVLIGSLTTICAAIVGAIATIIAALISRQSTHNKSQQERIEDYPSLDKVSSNDRLIRVQENSAVIISDLEVTLSVRLIILDDQVNFEYRTPHMENPFIAKNAEVGFQQTLECKGERYALTLTRIDGIKKNVFFDLRKISRLSKPFMEKPVPLSESNIKSHQQKIEVTGTCSFCGAQYKSIEKPKKCSYCDMAFL